MDVELLTSFEKEQIGERQALPERYLGLSDDEMEERIARARAALGSRLLILGHHYQRDEVFRFADCTGDSFKLARQAAERRDADYIVFCGVHFMAESADVLSAPHQQVVLPDLAAGCSMADMAEADQLEVCWDGAAGDGRHRRGAGHLHKLRGGNQGVLRRARRRGLHVEQRRSDARVGVAARPADPVPPGPAPGPQHRLQDGCAARRDGGLGSGSRVRRRVSRGPAARPDDSLEGPLLRTHALQRQAVEHLATPASEPAGHRASRMHVGRGPGGDDSAQRNTSSRR